jgi:glycosyltransferase involved in cell wall biosynthesis
MPNTPLLSIVVPLYNEEESVRPLDAAIRTAMNQTDFDYEVIFVDDGSSDRTCDIIIELSASDPRLKLIKLRRNFGQTPAMAAGIDHAAGKIIVTMDGDLQNDPADIPRLIDRISDGFDIVAGWRYNRQDKLITRKIPSMIANWIIGKVTGVPIKDNGCSLKAYRSSVIQKVPLYSDMHRFIPAMASITGARISEIKVNHRARKYGSSKYGLSRTYKVLLDLLTIKTIISFSSRPMLWSGILALPFIIISVLLVAAVFAKLLFGSGGSLIITSSMSILFGALACFLLLGGALGELIVKTAERSNHTFSFLTATRTMGTGSPDDTATQVH